MDYSYPRTILPAHYPRAPRLASRVPSHRSTSGPGDSAMAPSLNPSTPGAVLGATVCTRNAGSPVASSRTTTSTTMGARIPRRTVCRPWRCTSALTMRRTSTSLARERNAVRSRGCSGGKRTSKFWTRKWCSREGRGNVDLPGCVASRASVLVQEDTHGALYSVAETHDGFGVQRAFAARVEVLKRLRNLVEVSGWLRS